MQRSHSAKCETGFTILEILVATSMVGLIVATVLATFTGVMSGSRDAMRKVELFQTGRAVMELICADIRGFFPMTLPEGGHFFVGTTESVEGNQEMSRADFVTTHSLSIGIEPNPFMSEIGYRIKKNASGGLYSLLRRAQSPPEYPYEEGGDEVPICRIVESFHLEFVYGNDKNESLTSTLPDAVILSFILNFEGEREHFVTMVKPMVRG